MEKNLLLEELGQIADFVVRDVLISVSYQDLSLVYRRRIVAAAVTQCWLDGKGRIAIVIAKWLREIKTFKKASSPIDPH